MNIENLLYVEIETEFEKLSNMEPGSEEYKTTVDGLSKLMDRAIEMEKVDLDAKEKTEARMRDDAIELQKMEDDRKDRIVKNIIGAAGVILPLLVTIWGTKATFEFEKEGTVTTVLGRGFFSKLLPRK